MAPVDRLRSYTSFYWPSVVTIWPRLVSFTKQSEMLIESRDFFHTIPAFDAPVRGPRLNIATPFGTEKLE